MKLIKNIGVFVVLAILLAGAGLLFQGPNEAKALNIGDIRPSVSIENVGKFDPGIFAVPDATPNADDDDDAPTPINYSFDANDYMFFRYDDKFSVKVDSGEAVEYQNQNLRISLKPKEGNPVIEVVVGFTLIAPGKFKIQVGTFDAAKYDAVLELVSNGVSSAPITLTPDTVVELVAHNMSTMKFAGEATPGSGDAPEEQILLSNRTVVYLVSQQAGSLLVNSRDIVDTDDVPTNPNPIPSPIPQPSPIVTQPPPSNPDDNNNGGNNNGGNNGGSSLPAAAGNLTGGNGGLKCSLHQVAGRAHSLLALLALVPMGLALRKKKSAR